MFGGTGGESASGAVKGECVESALELGGGVVVGFFSGGRWASQLPKPKGECFESALELSSSAGNGGESASGAVKGECFESALELSSSAGNGGESASGAVKGGWGRVSFGGGVVVGVFFFGGRGPVSFRGCERGTGGQSALVVVSSSVFLFRGDGGQSASGAVKGGWGRVSFGVVFFCGE